MRLAIVGELPSNATAAGALGRCYDIASLSDALTGNGHEVRLFTASSAGSARVSGDYEVVTLPVEVESDGLSESLMPAIGDLSRLLVDQWTHDTPDVVHCHGLPYGMATQLAAKRHPVPTVQSFDGLDTLTQRRGTGAAAPGTRIRLQTLLVKNATTVAAACTDDLQELIRFACPRTKVSVVPAGVTVDEEQLAAAPQNARDASHQVVAFASGPARYDRLADVVKALPVLAHTHLRLVAAGPADQRDISRLHQLAARLGAGDRMQTVTVDDEEQLCAVFRSADVVVCPASYDAYGTVALQAMANGAAVVAAGAGGMRDAVIPEVTGLLVPPGNIDALRRALRSLISQPVLREGMGLAGRSRARSRYSWARVATDAELAYRAAAERHRAARERASA